MPPQCRDQLVHAFYWTRSSLLTLLVSEWPPQVQAWGCFLRQAVEMSPPPSLALPHTYTHALSPSRLHSFCLFPLVSSDWRAPQTVFTPPQALRHRHRAAGLLPYEWMKSNLNMSEQRTGDQHIQYSNRNEKGRWALSCSCTHQHHHPPPTAHFYQGGRWVPAQRGLFNVLITGISPPWYDTW